MITREQIQWWREWAVEQRPLSSAQRMSFDALCDAALRGVEPNDNWWKNLRRRRTAPEPRGAEGA